MFPFPRALEATTPYALAALAALTLWACGEDTTEAQPGETEGARRDRVAWSEEDSPRKFSEELEVRFDALPLQGAAHVAPWAGNYWPTWQDSLNYPWAGEGSQPPSSKYAAAFGVQGVEDAVSQHHGIDANKDRTACTADAQCNAEIGEKCAKRTGQESGHCVPTWWGICHAWAPAAILYAEPVRPVTHNGVEFAINDIKALITLATEEVEESFVSVRCDADAEAGGIDWDEHGRPTTYGCIDTNPGTWHLLLTNFLGLRGEAFVEDRTYDDEVWNQPLRAFRVKAHREVDALTANGLIGVKGKGAVDETTQLTIAKSEWVHRGPFPVIEGTAFSASLKGTGDADLYVRFGGQPTSRTYDCRPYQETSVEACSLTVPTGATEAYVSVNGYAETNAVELTIQTSGAPPAEYLFNDQAARFVYIEAEVDFVAESPADMDGNLAATIDTYTHTDRYTYILELNAEGDIIGGEWTGDSKRAHPDFVWLPKRMKATPGILAGGLIRHGEVLAVYHQSIEAPSGSARHLVQESFRIDAGKWRHFGPFPHVDGTEFIASLAGANGDADLYVRRGAQPTDADHDCRPWLEGSEELCRVSGAGDWYVSVNGYSRSDVRLVISHAAPAAEAPAPAPDAPRYLLDVVGSVEEGAYHRETLELNAGDKVRVWTEAPKDVDLYLKWGSRPTIRSHDVAPYLDHGNESAEFTATQAGTLHIGVRGYEASDFLLRAERL